ncbi:hypothetical protein GCM10010873_08430 [Cypionkella aquatica]|uniref:Pyruvate/2-oxoglutarate dehydrogenase complex, dihydrolipoamide acyltransferase (E2) component n=1 Tax=Cypionkella aquatica TaxID=1756042 RepID=A0AA37U1G4_9RHOB|nr:DUF3035 domain-containing protein [Cypionkella aquatica]GLS85869.1 hypothetical protein GCM10010873_08430 [Cypionkella aquatica]
MRSARVVLAIAGAALLVLTACAATEPELMNLRSDSNGPDEFAILPPKSLELPTSLSDLPAPTPGGSNLTDPHPENDAIVALGGKPPATTGVSDAGLYNYATRKGVTPGIRAELAAEDLEFRSKNRGRPLERLFNLNVYYKAYEKMSLDQHAELLRWRAAGARTPSAPPRNPKE